MQQIELTGYHKWLLKTANDRKKLATLIYIEAAEHNPLAFDLINLTEDEYYTKETFLKAADILLCSK